jgi:hypothetical protein
MSKLKVNNLEPLSGSVVSIASNLAVDGTLTAKVLKTELTQSAILYESGSTKFGDSPDDLHQFTGSVQLEGSFQASGQTNLLRFYFPNSGTLPPAGDWHGMLAHVHDEGNIQFAHGGSWVKLSNEADVTALSSSLDSKIDSEILALSSSTDAHLDAEILALSSSADSQRIHYYSQSVIAAATDNLSLSGSAHDQRVHIGSSLSTDLTDVSSSLYSHISTNTAGIATEKARVDAILSSSVADTDSFAEIVTLINSVDTENDTAFAGYVTSSTSRMDGIDTTISTLSGSAHTQRVANKTELSNNITAVSSSFETTVGSLTDRVATNESDITDIQNNSLGYASTGSNEFIGDQRISGSLAVGYTSASIANVLTIAPTDPADFPPTAATGSLMVTTGGVLRYYDGTQWYNVVLA